MPESVAKKVQKFFGGYPLHHYDKGQLLILADEDPKHIFYLVSGKVRQYDISYRGDEIVVNVFKPPAFFPMSWAINKTPNRYFFEAATKVTLHQAPPDATLEFIKDNPDVAFDLLSRVYSGLDGLLMRSVHLMSRSARHRLLLELIIECRRFGELKPNGSCHITINETELGARAGLSRETVNREIGELKKTGLVEVGGGTIVIKNITQAEQELGTER